MKRFQWVACLALMTLLAAGCSSTKTLPTATRLPTLAQAVPTLIPSTATDTPAAEPTSSIPPTDTSLPPTSAAPTAAGSSGLTALDVSTDRYIDDRSGVQILTSLFNAINRKEYVRAYSYWSSDSGVGATPYAQFEAGYADTEEVQVQIGAMTVDAGAGNYYTAVPVALSVAATSGAQRYYVGCYVMHQAAPGIFGEPPFVPVELKSAAVQTVTSPSEFSARLATVCAANEGSPVSPPAAAAADDIRSSRFLDDRSDALQIVRSFYNAINRGELVRAFSYFTQRPAGEQAAAFTDFTNQYEGLSEAAITVGEITSDAGAGQFYSSLPVVVTARDSSGAELRTVGCIVTHISNPSVQGVPPFQPLSITSSTFEPLADGADVDAALASACQP